MTTATITELEVLFSANTKPVDDAAKKVRNQAQKIEGTPVEQKIDGDAKGALAAMDRVETEAKKIVSAKTMATVDANIERAETGLAKVQERLDYLRSVETTMEVKGDIKRAESALQQLTRRRDALVAAKETMTVDADTSPAESALDELADDAGEAGAEGGDEAGAGLADGITAALQALPVAGAVVLAGVAIGKTLFDAVQDGLGQEVSRDRLQALTGITEQEARTIALGAGEAYANVFGESIEANMDTGRLALQLGLLDDDATARESQSMIQSLTGIADVLSEDVGPVARAVTTMLSAGIVDSAEQAFDVLATGAREGVNVAEDLLDTYTEYPALFSRLGLTAGASLGLLNQGLQAGARNSDLVADALKEFQIRATDASESSAEGFRILGLDAEEMTAKIARGGADAREGLDEVLDGLREIEDPVARNAAAVALFGTQAEDLGSALFALDLSTAVGELNGVTGAAQAMFDTLADNDATKLEEAKRNIEVAVEGIQGALAVAFSDPLSDAAEWVSANRGPMLGFFAGLVNGAIDFGVAAVEGAAAATEGFGTFVSGPLADTVEGIAGVLDGLSGLPFVDLGDEVEGLTALADDMRTFDDTTAEAADGIRDELIPQLEGARTRFNEFADPQIALGYLHDASLRLAGAISEVGYAADGSELALANLDTTNLSASETGSELERQILAAVDALDAEAEAGAAAGETQAALAERYEQGRQALVDQLVAMGLAEDEAIALADAYGAVPENVSTIFEANTTRAQLTVDKFILDNDGRRLAIRVDTVAGQQTITTGQGALTQIGMAAGGVLGTRLTPMAPIAQAVPPNTWRVVGDRLTHREFYIPEDGSARSMAVLLEAMRSFGVLPMSAGGEVSPGGRSSGGGGVPLGMADYLIRGIGDHILRAMQLAGGSARALAEEHTDRSLFGEAVPRR